MFSNQNINRQYSRIKSLIIEAKQLESDDEMQSHLAKYLCVLCSGFIENAIYHTFSDIVENEISASIILAYTKSQLYKIQNTNSEKIRALAKSFNPDWHDPLTEFLQENSRSTAINYILKERHNIAHGRDSNITIGTLENYLAKTTEVILYLETNLNN